VHSVDYLIVGSGLTGAVIGRILTDAGRSVLILDRRNHLGGNVSDHVHPSGIRIHTYGPHYFRTNCEEIWEFVTRFAEFYPYEACLRTFVDGCHEQWPIAESYIRRTIGDRWEPEFKGVPRNFEEASLAIMPRLIYEKFVKGYNEKQWGVTANSLSATLVKRFDVRKDDEPRLVRHKYQGIPTEGYSSLMRNLVAGIPLILNCDYLAHRKAFRYRKKLIFTGPIDEFFGFDLGRLHYRGQVREHRYLPDLRQAQPCGQVNNPSRENGPHIRTLEWKQMMQPEFAERIVGTVTTTETTVTPTDPDKYEYPFPNRANEQLYRRYRKRVNLDAKILVCGRLGEYRYYDMDQAIARAMKLASAILAEGAPARPKARTPVKANQLFA
jgi:UDP-galactopyranose mutase